MCRPLLLIPEVPPSDDEQFVVWSNCAGAFIVMDRKEAAGFLAGQLIAFGITVFTLVLATMAWLVFW